MFLRADANLCVAARITSGDASTPTTEPSAPTSSAALDLPTDQPFDAIVGRYVLMFLRALILQTGRE
jgi:hypothetical protein